MAAPADLCAEPPTEEVAALCTIHAARARIEAGEAAEGLRACEGIPAPRWRGECAFRVAEALAARGEGKAALAACGRAGTFARMCVGHVAWLGSADLVDAAPGDPAAQAAIDAFAEALPAIEPAPAGSGRERWGVAEVVRGAAWLGVYAGSGSADPVAARAAADADAPLARGAFAWEAVRLLGPMEGAEPLVAAVLAIWRGERAPPAGAPLPQSCWRARLVPRHHLGYDEARTVRTWSGGERFVAPDAGDDLRIAAMEARWAGGVDFTAPELARLVADPSLAVRLTGARHAGAATAAVPDLAAFLGGAPDLLALAREVREATLGGASGRSVTATAEAPCAD